MATADFHGRPQESVDRRRLVAFLVGLPAYFALCMFLPAGDWEWLPGWLFLGVFLVGMTASAAYLWRVNPAVVAARTGYHAGTEPWDRVLVWLLLACAYSVVPLAALDAGHFHWSALPWWGYALGYALFLAGFGVLTAAQSVNKHFEVTVRIQADRGHTVVQTGPYAVVRHPGYVGGILFFLGAALALGSLWALVPAGLASALLILRTWWEDRTLQEKLAGYQEYARRVRYRLLPGIW